MLVIGQQTQSAGYHQCVVILPANIPNFPQHPAAQASRFFQDLAFLIRLARQMIHGEHRDIIRHRLIGAPIFFQSGVGQCHLLRAGSVLYAAARKQNKTIHRASSFKSESLKFFGYYTTQAKSCPYPFQRDRPCVLQNNESPEIVVISGLLRM